MRGTGQVGGAGKGIGEANQFARAASATIHAGHLGYELLVAGETLQAVNLSSGRE